MIYIIHYLENALKTYYYYYYFQLPFHISYSSFYIKIVSTIIIVILLNWRFYINCYICNYCHQLYTDKVSIIYHFYSKTLSSFINNQAKACKSAYKLQSQSILIKSKRKQLSKNLSIGFIYFINIFFKTIIK